jgi:hypothetical protein
MCIYTPAFWLASSLTSTYDDVRYAPFLAQILLAILFLMPLYIFFNHKKIAN